MSGAGDSPFDRGRGQDPAAAAGGDDAAGAGHHVDVEAVDGELLDEEVDVHEATADAPPELGDDADEDLIEAVQTAQKIAAERDEYLDTARRLQAEFENYKRRVDAQRDEQRERAAESLARELLPVLDAGAAAAAQGLEDAAALYSQLLGTLEKQGLSSLTEAGVEFDPNIHEAVMHEEGDGGAAVVAEVLRTGYLWNQRVLRPAMVKVRG